MDFILRPFKNSDINSLVKHGSNPRIAANMTDQFPNPYTPERAVQFIEFASQHTPPNILAITVHDEVVGGIGIHPQQDVYKKNAELGYWLSETFWGKGIITKAITQMVEYGFANWPVDRIFARPFHTNIGSQKALEKAGFVLEGKFEKTIYKNNDYLDELVYATRRQNQDIS